MACNSSASLYKLTCTDYMDFGKCQHRRRQFFGSENDSLYLDIKLIAFGKFDNNNFRTVQNLTKREADFNQFMRLKNQLGITVENFGREENLSWIPTTSKDMFEQLKLAHKKVHVVDRANRNICNATLLWYSVDKTESSYSQVRLLASSKEDEKFDQIV